MRLPLLDKDDQTSFDTKTLNKLVDTFLERGFTSCLEDAKEKGIIYGTGAWNMGDIIGSKAMKQAYEMGKAI
jgi:hypothetical protein